MWLMVIVCQPFVRSSPKVELSRSMKRLKNNAALRVAACNVRGVVHGEWWEGTGCRSDDPATIQRAYAALHRKYGWLMRITDFFSRMAGRIEGRAIIEIELAS